MVRASLILSGVFLAIICALCFWTFSSLNSHYSDTLEMNAFDDVYFDTHLLLNPDEIGDVDFDSTILERNISSKIMMLMTSLDPDKADENRIREDIWLRLQLDDLYPFSDVKSRTRLETLYTPEKIAELFPLLSEMRDHFRRRNWKTLMRTQELKSFLALFFALLAISIGTSFISFEMVRRKTA